MGNAIRSADTTIAYDAFDLARYQVTDAAWAPRTLTTTIASSSRSRSPIPTAIRTRFTFTPARTAQSDRGHGQGRTPRGYGDAPAAVWSTTSSPSSNAAADLRSYHPPRAPRHRDDRSPERDETIETVEYSDGFGRLLQTRTQAEDVIFGDADLRQRGLLRDQSNDDPATHDGSDRPERRSAECDRERLADLRQQGARGREVRAVLFQGLEYVQPQDAQFGQKATMFYDPRGQVIRTVNPDGSEQRVIYGVPHDLADPSSSTRRPGKPTPTMPNDNAGRTHPTEAKSLRTLEPRPAS